MRNLSLSRESKRRYKGNNLGLHCHCAETKEKFIELLERAKNENVRYLVVNNYKSLKTSKSQLMIKVLISSWFPKVMEELI